MVVVLSTLLIAILIALLIVVFTPIGFELLAGVIVLVLLIQLLT